MIIGLCGAKGAGKDTVAAYLVKEHGFERRTFADPLKRSVAALLDIPYHEIENFKNDPTVFVTTGYKNEPNPPRQDPWAPNSMWSPIRELTFREFLQRYGTESHRDVFDYNFWVDMTLPAEGFYAGRAIVVTDVRFPNEVDRVVQLGGRMVRVVRPGSNGDAHLSETALQGLAVSYTITNDGDIPELFDRVEEMLEVLLPDRVG